MITITNGGLPSIETEYSGINQEETLSFTDKYDLDKQYDLEPLRIEFEAILAGIYEDGYHTDSITRMDCLRTLKYMKQTYLFESGSLSEDALNLRKRVTIEIEKIEEIKRR